MIEKKLLRFKIYKSSEENTWIVSNKKRKELGYIELYRGRVQFESDGDAYNPCIFYANSLIELAAFMRSQQCRNGLTATNRAK